METSSSPTSNPSSLTNINTSSNPVRLRYNLSASNLIHTPLLTLLDYFGLLHNPPISPRDSNQDMQALLRNPPPHFHHLDASPSAATSSEEVSIRIIASSEEDDEEEEPSSAVVADTGDHEDVENHSSPSTPLFTSPNAPPRGEEGAGSAAAAGGDANNNANGDSTNQRYGIQQIARWFEQILPFSLLLLVVFIRQHLQGTSTFLKCSTFDRIPRPDHYASVQHTR